MPDWHSLYISTDSTYPDSAAVSAALLAALETLGYQRYDPFAGGMGTPPGLKTFVKLFAAPAQDGWVRILGEPDLAAPAVLSASTPVLHAWLSDTASGIDVYINGARDEQAVVNYLMPSKTRDDLARAERGDMPTLVDRTPASDMLPPDIQKMAQDHNVDPQQANKMMERITGQLFGKMDRRSGGEASAMQDQARALISGSKGANWNSTQGQRLKALASVLTLPHNWRDPDFDVVRDAYQVARRLQRTPSAQLMPDEQAAIRALPNAIEYEAVYVGK
jgi:hypothetical protein